MCKFYKLGDVDIGICADSYSEGDDKFDCSTGAILSNVLNIVMFSREVEKYF